MVKDNNFKTIVLIKPQYIPIRCPVCKGFGTVNFGKSPCKACEKLGYLKIPPEKDSYGGE